MPVGDYTYNMEKKKCEMAYWQRMYVFMDVDLYVHVILEVPVYLHAYGYTHL
mgnify:CR=1 FL=1